MASFIPLADAVKALLNQQTFSRSFVAARIYDPLRPLEITESMRVDVILGDRKSVPLDRSRMQNTCRVEIALREKIKPLAGSDDERVYLDGLVGFMEELDDCLSDHDNRRPPAAPYAAWQGSELVYPFLPLQLRSERQFTSLLRLTYIVITGPATQ